MRQYIKFVFAIAGITLFAGLSFFIYFQNINNENKEIASQSWPEIRQLSRNLIEENINTGAEYLLRVIDKKENGVHKYYYPASDTFEDRLYPLYTASTVYTLLKVYNFKKDEAVLEQAIKSADFMFLMQQKDKKNKSYGAFYYSYFPDKNEKELKFVVGTAAKSIFTMLKLWELTENEKYIGSAILAGDWLLTMQKTDGSMKSYLRYSDGKWYSGAKESLLYNGQVLSALSRLYIFTENEKYLEGAKKIAEFLLEKYEKAGRNFVEDDYREKNLISNSWVVMSLIDFHRAQKNDYFKEIIFELADKILKEQRNKPSEILTYGQWKGAYSTSGNSWISEVMAELYHFCKEENSGGCEKYKEAVLKTARWLIQNTYSEQNVLGLKNPQMAIGGVPWDRRQEYIRTDSVCHALNSYLGVIDSLPEGLLLSIP